MTFRLPHPIKSVYFQPIPLGLWGSFFHLRSLAFPVNDTAYSASAQQGVVIGSNATNPTPPDANQCFWLINDNQGMAIGGRYRRPKVQVYNAADNTVYQ